MGDPPATYGTLFGNGEILMYPFPRIPPAPFDPAARARMSQQAAFVSLSVLLQSLYAPDDVTHHALLDALNAAGFPDEEIAAALGRAEAPDGTYVCGARQ